MQHDEQRTRAAAATAGGDTRQTALDSSTHLGKRKAMSASAAPMLPPMNDSIDAAAAPASDSAATFLLQLEIELSDAGVERRRQFGACLADTREDDPRRVLDHALRPRRRKETRPTTHMEMREDVMLPVDAMPPAS